MKFSRKKKIKEIFRFQMEEALRVTSGETLKRITESLQREVEEQKKQQMDKESKESDEEKRRRRSSSGSHSCSSIHSFPHALV